MRVRLFSFGTVTRAAVLALLVLSGPAPWQAPSARAQTGSEAGASGEAAGNETKAIERDAQAREKAKRRLEALKRQHEELDFKKRTKAPFTSERSLRHEMRRNEAQQGWEKSEKRRLEYEQQRRELESRDQR